MRKLDFYGVPPDALNTQELYGRYARNRRYARDVLGKMGQYATTGTLRYRVRCLNEVMNEERWRIENGYYYNAACVLGQLHGVQEALWALLDAKKGKP